MALKSCHLWGQWLAPFSCYCWGKTLYPNTDLLTGKVKMSGNYGEERSSLKNSKSFEQNVSRSVWSRLSDKWQKIKIKKNISFKQRTSILFSKLKLFLYIFFLLLYICFLNHTPFAQLYIRGLLSTLHLKTLDFKQACSSCFVTLLHCLRKKSSLTTIPRLSVTKHFVAADTH